MDSQQGLKTLMDKVVKTIRYNSFVPEYQEKATIEECVGLAVSKYLEWDSRIFTAFSEALEDANFHTEAEKARELLKNRSFPTGSIGSTVEARDTYLTKETYQKLIAQFKSCLYELGDQSESLIDDEKRNEIFQLIGQARETIEQANNEAIVD